MNDLCSGGMVENTLTDGNDPTRRSDGCSVEIGRLIGESAGGDQCLSAACGDSTGEYSGVVGKGALAGGEVAIGGQRTE